MRIKKQVIEVWRLQRTQQIIVKSGLMTTRMTVIHGRLVTDTAITEADELRVSGHLANKFGRWSPKTWRKCN